ncbi:MAG: proline dehydrogenase family protein [Cyclobacteriaceae bacterium]
MDTPVAFDFNNTEIAFRAKTDQELNKAFILFASINNNFLSSLGTKSAKLALKLNLPIKNLIKNTVFQQFCGGENIDECRRTIEKLAKYGIKAILDYAVEGAETEESYDQTTEEIIRTIHKAKESPNIPFSVFKPTGLGSKVILEKIQLNQKLSDEEKQSFERIRQRFDKVCSTAFQLDVCIMIDSEDSWYQDPIDDLVYEMMVKYNKQKPIVYNTYQMYRKKMLENLKKAFLMAARENIFLGAKLVRGAYMEKERERADKMGYEDPILPDKQATDNAYDVALKFCIDNKQRIALVSGSHNEYSNYYLTVLMDKYGINKNDTNVFFAQLYGMSDHISFNLAEAGFNVVKYVPYGPIKEVMPYLFRRAEENTAIAGQSSRESLLIKREIRRRKNLRK